MKKTLIVLLFAVSNQFLNAQAVGIGTNSPNGSAQLDVASTTKGLLIPRMNTAQRTAIASPANGLLVYDTNLSAFYFYNGTSWNAVNSGGGSSNSWTASGSNIYNSNTGNVGIGLSTGMKEKLSVKGNLFVTYVNENDITNGGNRATINLHGANIGGSRINFLNTDSTVGAYINYYRLSSQLKDFSLNHGTNTNQLTLNENGNVGIGKIATEKLDVNGNIRIRKDVIVDSNVSVKGTIDADDYISGVGLRSTSGLIVTQASTLAGPVLGGSYATFSGEITSNAGMTINDAAGILAFKASATDKAFVQLSGDDLRLGTFSPNTAGRFIVRTGGANNLIVANDGKTGIGIEAPEAKLHINSGTSIEALRIQGNTNSVIRFMSGATEKAYIYSVGNDLNISTVQPGGLVRFNNELYVDKDAGRVGIGTIAPEQKLHVEGKLKVSGTAMTIDDGRVTGTTTGSSYNLLPICYGRVSATGSKQGGTSNFTASRANTTADAGVYVIHCSQISTSSVVMVTVTGGIYRYANAAIYVENGAAHVYITSDGDLVDNDFHFLIFDP